MTAVKKILHTQRFDTPPATSVGLGDVAGTGVTVEELGDGINHRTKFTLKDTPFALLRNAGTVGGYGGLKIYDFPAGVIAFKGAAGKFTILKGANTDNAFDGDWGLGSAAAGNNASLAGTEQNILPTTPTPQAVSGLTTATGFSSATERTTVLDGTSSAIDLFLNILLDDADVSGAPGDLTLNGWITVDWTNLGDF